MTTATIERVCTVDGCRRRAHARGYCQTHYTRWRVHGDVTVSHHRRLDDPLRTSRAKCSIDGCERDARARGWCERHWNRWRRHGDPMHSVNRRATADVSVAQRFWDQVEVGLCWRWSGANDRGYGLFRLNGVTVRAHRWAWEHLVGPIPSGLQLDHLCRNPSCVNPDHLEPVTQAENVRRGHAALWW